MRENKLLSIKLIEIVILIKLNTRIIILFGRYLEIMLTVPCSGLHIFSVRYDKLMHVF